MNNDKITIECTCCKKRISKKVAFCTLCGADVRGSSKEDVSESLQCPKCCSKLELVSYRGKSINKCTSCHGLWLDLENFQILTTEHDVNNDPNISGLYKKGSWNDELKYIKCPRCKNIMNRKNFADISGIIIDECSNHGIFLDAGELKRIREFIAGGGLEKASDKKLGQHTEQLRMLERAKSHQALMNRLMHFWDKKRWLFDD